MKLKPRTVSIEDLLLDPNNPRLERNFQNRNDFDPTDPVACQRVLEEQFKVPKWRSPVQQELDRLIPDKETEDQDDFFSIKDLKQSMRRIGYVGIQNIIVREHEPSGKFIVLEGNRRVASIKSVLREHEAAPAGTAERLSDALLDSMREIEVMVFETEGRAERDIQHEISTMLGLRHYGSQLMWEPLPRAKNIYDEYMKCIDGDEFRYESELARRVAETLAIERTEVRQFLRGYICYRQLIPSGAKPRHFSLILAGVENKNLNTHGFFRIDSDTFRLEGDTAEKLERVCEFRDRDSSDFEKTIKDPKSFTKLGWILRESKMATEDAVQRFATGSFEEVINKQSDLEDAYTNLKAFKLQHRWVQAIQDLIKKQKEDEELVPETFVSQGQELRNWEDLDFLVKRILRFVR